MTALQKAIFAAVFAIALGTGIYQARQVLLRREETQTLRQQQARLVEQIPSLRREREDAMGRLTALEEENKRLKSGEPAAELLKLRSEAAQWRDVANDPTVSAIRSSLAKVERLKQRLEQTPGAKIPEFQFLTEEDWLNAAAGSLSTEEDYRRAFSALRNVATQAFAPQLMAALRKYLQTSHGEFPTDISRIQPCFEPPVEDALLQRWHIEPKENFPNIGSVGSMFVVTQKGAVDEEYDTCAVLGPEGAGWCNFKLEKAYQTLIPVFQAYQTASAGKDSVGSGQPDLSLLKPYAKTPGQQAALDILLQSENAAEN